jgi:hypothetical protein
MHSSLSLSKGGLTLFRLNFKLASYCIPKNGNNKFLM